MHTQSATELTAVLIEPMGAGANVWLRRNIETVQIDLGDGLSQTMWEADEVSGIVGHVPTAEEVEEGFDAMWEAFEQNGKNDRELIMEAMATAEQAAAQAWFTALLTDTEVGE